MKASFSYCKSTIGRKQLLGLTGLGLSGFVLIHMLGNLLILNSAESYNTYSYKLTSNPLIYIAEVLLLGMFLGHVTLAIGLTLRNKMARKERYAVLAQGEKETGLIQKTLIHQGMIILIFTVFHLVTFKYGPHYSTEVHGVEMRDLFKLVAETFQQPLFVGGYVIVMLLLGFHLSHGVGSSIRTFGCNHPKYDQKIRCISKAFGAVVSLGFIVPPLWIYFTF